MTRFKIAQPEPFFLRQTLGRLARGWSIEGDVLTMESDELGRLMRALMPAHLQPILETRARPAGRLERAA